MAAALALLLVLHPPVLKPDLNLFLGQVQVCGDLDAPQSGEVHVRGELSLQLQKLRTGEGCAHAFAALKFAVAVFCEINIKRTEMSAIVRERGQETINRLNAYVEWRFKKKKKVQL